MIDVCKWYGGDCGSGEKCAEKCFCPHGKIATQYLRIYPNMTIVEPDTKCPKCGRPWKEEASYGHNICCGCSTCGFSMSLFAIDDLLLGGLI